ncbi:hypothetical protein D3C72_1652770 [compost metagenome]
MVGMTATVVANCSTDVLRNGIQVGNQFFNALILQLWCTFECCIKISDICVVVTIMVNVHGLFVDMWFKCICWVRQCW